MSRQNLEDNLTRRQRHNSPSFGTAKLLLTGPYPISDSGPTFHFLDPNGSNRNVVLPAIRSNGGQLYFVKNTGSSGSLLIVDVLGAAVDTVVPGDTAILFSSPIDWGSTVQGTSPAPGDAEYIVKSANAVLTAERVLTDTTSITWDFATSGQAKAIRAAITGDITIPAGSNVSTLGTLAALIISGPGGSSIGIDVTDSTNVGQIRFKYTGVNLGGILTQASSGIVALYNLDNFGIDFGTHGTSRFQIDNTGILSATNTFIVNPAVNTFNKGFAVTQTGPASGSVAGQKNYNTIDVTHLSAVTSSGGDPLATQVASALKVTLTEGGANEQGFMVGGYFRLNHTVGNTNNATGDHVALATQAYSNKVESGTGGLFGFDTIAYVDNGGSLMAAIGMNSEVAIKTGGAVNYREGMRLQSEGEVQGGTVDSAITILSSGAGPGWKRMIDLSGAFDAQSISSTGDLFHATQALTVANVFNTPNLTVTGDFANLPNFRIAGSGIAKFGSGGTLPIAPTVIQASISSGGYAALSSSANTTTGFNGFDTATSTGAASGSFIVSEAARTTTRFGVTVANWVELLAGGVSNNGLIIGTVVSKPILFGVGGVESGRVTPSGGLAWGLTTDTTAGIINTLTGFRINSAAASGHVLRGNGTNYIDAQLAAADLSNGITGTAGSAVVLTTSPTIASPTFTGTVVGAATIPNSVLANSSVTYGTTSVALGASNTAIAGITSFGLTSGSTVNWNSDVFIGRAGAANFMHGAADAASPIAQTLSVQNVVAGTSNTAGANLTIAGSKGTGTGIGGSILLQTSAAGSTGTAQNTLTTRFTLLGNGNIGVGTETNPKANLVVSNNVTTGLSSFSSNGIYLIGKDSQDIRLMIDGYGGTSGVGGITYRNARGTAASPTAIQANDILGYNLATGYGSTGFNSNSAAGFFFAADQNFTDANQGMRVEFKVTPNNTNVLITAGQFNNSGGFSVGTTSDPGVGTIYINNATFLIRTKTSFTNGAAASVGSLTNAPAAGNPTKWIAIDDNGTTRQIPAW